MIGSSVATFLAKTAEISADGTPVKTNGSRDCACNVSAPRPVATLALQCTSAPVQLALAHPAPSIELNLLLAARLLLSGLCGSGGKASATGIVCHVRPRVLLSRIAAHGQSG